MILHKIHVSFPNGQYLVNIPRIVIGIVSKQIVESATASVAIKMLRAVFISEMVKMKMKENIITLELPALLIFLGAVAQLLGIILVGTRCLICLKSILKVNTLSLLRSLSCKLEQTPCNNFLCIFRRLAPFLCLCVPIG